VQPEHVKEFMQTYGPDGDWVRLFRRFPGYIRTELMRDRGNIFCFVTIDYWKSFADWESFRNTADEEFVSLDERCEQWTERETEVGRYDASSGSPL